MKRPILIFVAALAVIIGLQSFYIVDQRQQVLMLLFGKPVTVKDEPGLQLKIPFFHEILRFDKRILNFNARPKEMIAADQKRIIVDSYAKYRISDPLRFFQRLKTEQGAKNRLDKILESSMRKVIGTVPLNALLTEQRTTIMERIREDVNTQGHEVGLEVVDVRIMRADLPKENSDAIYRRMQTEREREAKEFRAQGEEEAQKIRSTADKESRVIIAEANKQANITRGEGDAIATEVYASSFGKDTEFFEFYRSMQAYRSTINQKNTNMVLSPGNEFLHYFEDMNGKK